MDIELGHISQVTNFWLSIHNFGEVAVIQKFQYFPKYGTASNMAAPYKTLFNFGNIEIFESQLLCQNYDWKSAT